MRRQIFSVKKEENYIFFYISVIIKHQQDIRRLSIWSHSYMIEPSFSTRESTLLSFLLSRSNP